MKCNQSRLGFELVSPCSFPTTKTITPRAPPNQLWGNSGESSLFGLGKSTDLGDDNRYTKRTSFVFWCWKMWGWQMCGKYIVGQRYVAASEWTAKEMLSFLRLLADASSGYYLLVYKPVFIRRNLCSRLIALKSPLRVFSLPLSLSLSHSLNILIIFL